jgi:N-acetylneuraminate lyase
MKNGFQGLWPAMFTPVSENEAPVYEQMEQLIEILIGEDVDGLYILGSSGQGVLFNENTRMEIADFVCKKVNGRVPVMVQVGALRTSESIRLAQAAEKSGAAAISSVGPIYYTGDANTAINHYGSIAAATGLPFLPYQLGNNSIPGDTIRFVDRLMDIPNVKGMKLTTSNLLEISRIQLHAGSRLKLFSGADELICQASLSGTVGAIGSTYNLWGAACKKVITEFKAGNYALGKEFMLAYQDAIFTIMPHIWSFLRAGMRLKHGLEMGPTIAPLATSHEPWNDEQVLEIIEKVERAAQFKNE